MSLDMNTKRAKRYDKVNENELLPLGYSYVEIAREDNNTRASNNSSRIHCDDEIKLTLTNTSIQLVFRWNVVLNAPTSRMFAWLPRVEATQHVSHRSHATYSGSIAVHGGKRSYSMPVTCKSNLLVFCVHINMLPARNGAKAAASTSQSSRESEKSICVTGRMEQSQSHVDCWQTYLKAFTRALT